MPTDNRMRPSLIPCFRFSAALTYRCEVVPGWLHVVAWFMPLYHAANLLRALMLTGDVGAAGASAAWIVVVTGALFVLPLNLLRRRLVR